MVMHTLRFANFSHAELLSLGAYTALVCDAVFSAVLQPLQNVVGPFSMSRALALAELTLDDSLEGTVPCNFLKVISVDKDNVYEEVILSGFQDYDVVYRDIPEDQRPPKP